MPPRRRAPGVLRSASFGKDRPQNICSPEYLLEPIVRFIGRPRAEVLATNVRWIVDLDPCSNDEAVVPAIVRWTEADDGLELDWRFWDGEDVGEPPQVRSIFVNPPWGDLRPWLVRCAAARAHAEVIALIPLRSHRRCFDPVWATADAICFLPPVRFLGQESALPVPCVLVYWGKRRRAFFRRFAGSAPWQGVVLTRDDWERNVSRMSKQRYDHFQHNPDDTLGRGRGKKKEKKKGPSTIDHLRRSVVECIKRELEMGSSDDILRIIMPNVAPKTKLGELVKAATALVGDATVQVYRHGTGMRPGERMTIRVVDEIVHQLTERATLGDLIDSKYVWADIAKAQKEAAPKAKSTKPAAKSAKKGGKSAKSTPKSKKKAPAKPKRATPIKDLRERSMKAAAKAKPSKKPSGSSKLPLLRKVAAGKRLTNEQRRQLCVAGLASIGSGPGQAEYAHLNAQGLALLGRSPNDHVSEPQPQAKPKPKKTAKRTAELPGLDGGGEREDDDQDDDEPVESFRERGNGNGHPPAGSNGGEPKPGRAARSHGVADVDERVLTEVRSYGSGPIHAQVVADKLGISKATVLRSFHRFAGKKQMRQVGAGRSAHWAAL